MRVEVDPVLVGVAEMRLHGPAHAVEVLHPAIDDQGAAQALALDDPVQHGRSGIHAGLKAPEPLVEGETPRGQAVLARRDQAQGLVLGCALGLSDNEVALRIDKERVCHRAASVDAEDLNASDFSRLNIQRASSRTDPTSSGLG